MINAAVAGQLLIMVGVPLLLFWLLPRRLGTPRSLLGWGAATFVISQAVRLPLLGLLTWLGQKGYIPAPSPAWMSTTNIAILCLTSGLFEEGARYLGYRHAIPEHRSWRDVVTYGLGHGGFEAIIFGGLVAVTAVNLSQLAAMDPLALPGADEVARRRVAEQITAFSSMPWHLPLLGGIERLFTMCFHVAMSLLVLMAIVSRRSWPLLLAMALHAATNAVAVVTMQRLGFVAAEVALAAIAAVSLWYVFAMRPAAESAAA